MLKAPISVGWKIYELCLTARFIKEENINEDYQSVQIASSEFSESCLINQM